MPIGSCTEILGRGWGSNAPTTQSLWTPGKEGAGQGEAEQDGSAAIAG